MNEYTLQKNVFRMVGIKMIYLCSYEYFAGCIVAEVT